ncbi:hypothetical protein [Pantoea agglomerans]|uniref:Uncharacterized protein n=1 Tax=Enterobacter agglomerans TaxID=549 RepID=A0ACC5PLP6_ENTAG|nr:hypothetical protein [Pantoea agglomerans]MBD8125875.1 hypothetical protein [Pantoea agglomerans]
MQDLVIKMFGWNPYVAGGKAMAERLKESGVKDISVVGRGSVIVRNDNGEKLSHYRKAAKRFVEKDAQAVAAGSKDNDED